MSKINIVRTFCIGFKAVLYRGRSHQPYAWSNQENHFSRFDICRIKSGVEDHCGGCNGYPYTPLSYLGNAGLLVHDNRTCSFDCICRPGFFNYYNSILSPRICSPVFWRKQPDYRKCKTSGETVYFLYIQYEMDHLYDYNNQSYYLWNRFLYTLSKTNRCSLAFTVDRLSDRNSNYLF